MKQIYDVKTAASITALAHRIVQNNLCKEIVYPASVYNTFIPGFPKTSASIKRLMPKYKFSRKWYVADFDTQHYFEVEEWCKDQFGPHPRYPDAWSRWVHTYEDQIHFRDEKDYQWFVLRWGA